MSRKSNQFLYKSDYMEEILEHFHDGIYITDKEANTIYLNHSYELISGLTVTDMLGKNMKVLVAQGVISMSGTLTVLQTGKEVTLEQSFRTGKRAIITSTPIYGNGETADSIIMVVTIVREMTEIYSVRKEMRIQEQLKEQYLQELNSLKQELAGEEEIIAADRNMKKILRLIDHVKLVNVPVLLTGENGVGKGHIAAYMHSHSKRSSCAYMRINFSAVPKDDPVGYLFGHEDSHTGEYHMGLVESAAGGTVYLEDIEHMPALVQGRFLALLRDGQCVMGDGVMKKPDIRIIAGSNLHIEQLKQLGTISLDLLHAFAMFVITIPPLRERQDDIIPLAESFLNIYNKKNHTSVVMQEDAYRALYTHNWPGNVGELKNTIGRAAIMAKDSSIQSEDLLLDAIPLQNDSSVSKELPKEMDLKDKVAELEADYMTRAFQKYGNIREAAAYLGMDASTFTRKRQRYVEAGLMKR